MVICNFYVKLLWMLTWILSACVVKYLHFSYETFHIECSLICYQTSWNVSHNCVYQAFLAAWNAACTSSSDSIFHVPQRKKYLVKAIHFKGPFKASDLTVVVIIEILSSCNLHFHDENRGASCVLISCQWPSNR